MKPIIATLVAIAVLAVAAPAWSLPVDAHGPIPSDAPSSATQPTAPSSGTETWVVIAAAALAFAAGAGAARLAPALRPGVMTVVDFEPAAIEHWLGDATELMLDQAGVAPGSRVLDVAAADAERLASGTGAYDAAICRLGLLFRPDVATALSELHMALRPGGRVSVIVHSEPEHNPLLAVIRRRAAPRPRSFGLWRPGVLATALGAAGFVDVEVERVDAPLHLPSAADCVRFVRESFAALHALVAELDHAAQEEAWAAIEAELRAFEGAGGFRVPCQLLVAGGRRT